MSTTARPRSERSTASSTNNKLRKPPPARTRVPEPVHWLFRTNIPRKRQSYIQASPRRRNFFGMGEIVGVLANPAGTVKSLTESKRMLDEARQELQSTREKAQLRPTHTFSRLPGFFPRRHETQAIQRALEGEPSFTVLFGAPSVGKTALLREILSHPRYHVLHFDLRISGFADLESLYMSLSTQMEAYFEEIAHKGGWYEQGSEDHVRLNEAEVSGEGWDTFEAEAWGFKHDRIAIERRIGGEGEGNKGEVRPSDIARLMELFQSSLLRYREFVPHKEKGKGKSRRQASEDTVVAESSQSGKRWFSSRRKDPRVVSPEPEPDRPSDIDRSKWAKRVPVLFFDEAHKLPNLIPSSQTMQTLLDSTLVLTKQDRLCHVVHATSDPFYQGWLSRVGVLWYCKLISIGDLSKPEMRAYFRERVLPRLECLPPSARRLDFETLYDAFGGKVAHWYDYITDYVNSGGTLGIKQCSHFLQSHALLNLHIIHSSQAPGGGFDGPAGAAGNNTSGSIHRNGASGGPGANASTDATRASPETFLHPSLGAAGFRMYQAGAQHNLSFMSHSHPLSMHHYMGGVNPLIASFTPYDGVGTQPEFSPMQLLKVMSRFTSGGLVHLPYFHLCRELGARAVDGMIRGKVVDVKWTDGIPGAVDASRRPVSMAVNQGVGVGVSGGGVGGSSSANYLGPGQVGSAAAGSSMLVAQQSPQQVSVGQSGTSAGTGVVSGSTTAVDFHSNGSHQQLGNNPPPPLHSHSQHSSMMMPMHPPPPVFSEEDEAGSAADVMVPISEEEIAEQQRSFVQQQQRQQQIDLETEPDHPPPPFSPPPRHYGPGGYHGGEDYMMDDEEEEEDEEEVIGPKLFPVSPIMRYAMREVIKEYEDDRSVSEYASLSDVDEY